LWSPDGEWVSFRSIVLDSAAVSQNGMAVGLGIQLVRPDGTGERTVVSGQIRGYRWLSGGEGLLFAQGPSDRADLWKTTLTGQSTSLDLQVDKNGSTFDLQTPSR
jgi:hypothetical protein